MHVEVLINDDFSKQVSNSVKFVVFVALTLLDLANIMLIKRFKVISLP